MEVNNTSEQIVVQQLVKSYPLLQKAVVYYSLVAAFNQLNLTKREIQLLAFTNRRGNIAAITAKQQFVTLFDSSIATINNMISRLSARNLLVKQHGKIIVNPLLNLDLQKPLVLHLTLSTASSEPLLPTPNSLQHDHDHPSQ